eukprot:6530167-Prymnesium_polylepis.1
MWHARLPHVACFPHVAGQERLPHVACASPSCLPHVACALPSRGMRVSLTRLPHVPCASPSRGMLRVSLMRHARLPHEAAPNSLSWRIRKRIRKIIRIRRHKRGETPFVLLERGQSAGGRAARSRESFICWHTFVGPKAERLRARRPAATQGGGGAAAVRAG